MLVCIHSRVCEGKCIHVEVTGSSMLFSSTLFEEKLSFLCSLEMPS